MAFPPDAMHLEAWFGGHEREWNEGSAYRFAILRGEMMIGIIDLNDISEDTAELAYWLDEGPGVTATASKPLNV